MIIERIPCEFIDPNKMSTQNQLLFSFRIHDKKQTIYPADVVLFEGILVFYFPQIRDLFHMKLFVDTDSDTRLARRVPRDINERGRDLDQVLNQYMTFVKPAFEEFCSPVSLFLHVSC